MKTINRICLSVLAVSLGVMSLSGKTLKTDVPYEKDFENRKSTLNDASCFDIFESGTLSGERLEAMKFLYAYLPLADIASYTPEFFLVNVDASLKAREEMPWGNQVPDREFLHFVLPLRVNNEMLDGSRTIFFDELKDRVKGMSIEDAILEVNHWCHEKATYQPSDGRTSNPLSTVSQAIGRCGEESTFTVAALRAVGIPARQVYTPRWAHTDDNHAWVEAWANGKWYFLGACEPEPILNLAWFNQPASRGMLMNTTVFGKYDGPEEKIKETDLTTVINVTPNYAPTERLVVRVTDTDGKPVKGADVSFCLYNYADFYPAVTRKTDSEGMAEMICGLGDMVVWGVDKGRFGFVKGSPEEGKVWELVLDKDKNFTGDFEIDIVPPQPSHTLPVVTPEMVKANADRLAYEDSLRKAYTSTFVDADLAAQIAASHGWDKDRTTAVLTKSRGNHATILAFLESLSPEQLETGFALLENVNEKDLRDIRAEVLADNISNFAAEGNGTNYRYLLNPRVELEPLVPYKSYLGTRIDPKLQQEVAANPEVWVKWVKENIELDTVWNPQKIHINPIAVWNQKKSDARSRNIFFVASLRSMGVPARIDQMTGKTQYYANDGWVDVNFTELKRTAPRTGKINLTYEPANANIKKPIYYSHFAVHKITDGMPRQLEFDDGMDLQEISEKLVIDEGQYMTLTGQRLSDGSVLVKGHIFPVCEGDVHDKELVFRKDDEKVSVIGSLNAENLYHDLESDTDKSILSTTGRGNYILGIIRSNNEPSAHALNDISLLKDEFENLAEKVVILFSDEDQARRFEKDRFANLPSTLIFGIDNTERIIEELADSLNLPDRSLPIFVIADSFNRVMFVSQGYTIGLGDKLLEVLTKINAQ